MNTQEFFLFFFSNRGDEKVSASGFAKVFRVVSNIIKFNALRCHDQIAEAWFAIILAESEDVRGTLSTLVQR
jgi:hypothetical protein